MQTHDRNKRAIDRFRAALCHYDGAVFRAVLAELFARDLAVRLACPFEDLDGPEALYEASYGPSLESLPDLERRDTMVVAGDVHGDDWPCITATISGDCWLGIAPANRKITMSGLDFWCCENDTIRENWRLVDILDVYRQIGVDVFARMREYTHDRQ